MKKILIAVSIVLILSIQSKASDFAGEDHYASSCRDYPEFCADDESGVEDEFDGPEVEDFEGAIEENDSEYPGEAYWMDEYEGESSDDLRDSGELTDEEWEEHRDYHGTN